MGRSPDPGARLDGLAGVGESPQATRRGELLTVKAPGAAPSGGNLHALYMHDAGGNVGQLVAWTTNFDQASGNAWHACRLVARYEYDPYGRIVGQ
ncbi:MAG: hypothetical protein AB1601_04090 [Planctomycetota bacterium]